MIVELGIPQLKKTQNSLSGSNLGSYTLEHDTVLAMLGSHF